MISLSTDAIVLRVFRLGLGHDPAEALLRLSAAVAAAVGHVPHGQWALLDANMPLLFDLVEPVAVELRAPPVLVLSPQRARPTPQASLSSLGLLHPASHGSDSS